MPCTDDARCQSGSCYVIPYLGSFCGECNEDLDCRSGGCSPPDPFADEPASCNQGELGGGCQSDAVCQPGLVCAPTLQLFGLAALNACSECASDRSCGPGQLCVPLVDYGSFSGHRACIEAGSLDQDSYCELGPAGDQACLSGRCSVVDLQGSYELGACGVCSTDADCPDGTCVPASLDLETGTLSGSTCA